MDEPKTPLYSKIIEFVFKWLFVVVIFGGILFFALLAISLTTID